MKTPDFQDRNLTKEELAQFQRGVAMALALTFIPVFAMVYTASVEIACATFMTLWGLMNAWNYRWLIMGKLVDFIWPDNDKK